MNASHASNVGPGNLHPNAPRSVHSPRTALLLVMYAALAAQLAVWSSLAAHVGLTTAFTLARPGADDSLVVGGAIWLVQFTLAVVLATIRYRRHSS
jgi:hypothetical protein